MAWRCGLSTIDLFSVPDSLVDLRTGSKVAGTFRAPLRNAARLVGDVDALLALAECASQRAWTRPTVDGKALTIEGLRHPLVDEAVFFPASFFFVPSFSLASCGLPRGVLGRPLAVAAPTAKPRAEPLGGVLFLPSRRVPPRFPDQSWPPAARDTGTGPSLHHNQPGDVPMRRRRSRTTSLRT
jgi:hypothetical protein